MSRKTKNIIFFAIIGVLVIIGAFWGGGDGGNNYNEILYCCTAL